MPTALSNFESKPALDLADLLAMQALAREVWSEKRSQLNTGASVAQLAWAYGQKDAEDSAGWRFNLVRDKAGALRGWGWATAPEMIRVSADRFELSGTSLLWQVHPGTPEVLADLLDWFAVESAGAHAETAAREGDRGAIEELLRRGYVQDASAPWSAYNARTLEDVEEPAPPPGYTFSSMSESADVALRVDVHRAAWHPSSFTSATFRVVQSTPPYRRDLDILAIAPDGTVGASVLAWYDEPSRTGELEPVGTHPAHRRLGLARAASLYALQRLRGLGAAEATVSCRGDADYPIPARLYESVGFRRVSRDLGFRRNLED